MKRISIVIPAYNEETRVEKTVRAYHQFFQALQKKNELDYELLIVPNGCTDNTESIVHKLSDELQKIVIKKIPGAGKGIAVKAGFLDALTRENDLIGFVDADMATQPKYFYDLVKHIGDYDGIIASRYMKGAQVYPPRPFIKRWGSKIFFQGLVKLLFGMHYQDTQCGAKLFKRAVVESITPHMQMPQWAFDIELLYLCKRFGFKIKEYPTVWYDQADSKLQMMRSGLHMLGSLVRLRMRYMPFKKLS